MFVFVWEREREKEREGFGWSYLTFMTVSAPLEVACSPLRGGPSRAHNTKWVNAIDKYKESK